MEKNFPNKYLDKLEIYKRPLICTEYMAREFGTTFDFCLPIFKKNNIGCFNWGFVAGKTNTIFPWSSWDDDFTSAPEVWHHDILLPDKTPYDQEEIDFLKEILLK